MPRYFARMTGFPLVPPLTYITTEKCSRITMTAIIISNIFRTIVVITAFLVFFRDEYYSPSFSLSAASITSSIVI